MPEAKITIIGGGITGLSTAVALQKKGIDAVVYEKAVKYCGQDTGIVLSGNAIRGLMSMGIGEELLSLGVMTNCCILKSDSGKPIASFDYRSPTNIPNYLIIQRSVLHSMLIEALIPGTIHYGKNLLHFTQEENTKLLLTFEDGTSAMTDYLVGSDGGNSPIRTKLLPESQLTFSGYSCWRGFIEHTDLTNISFSETWGPRGRFGIAPLPGNGIYWYAFKKAGPRQKDWAKWNPIDLLFNFFYYHDPIQKILEDTLDENVIYDELHILQPLKHFHFGKILLMGDSAHAALPNIGQGASQAIEDSITLAKWASVSETFDEAFSMYNNERQERMEEIANEMKIYGRAAQVDFPVLCSIRNKLFQFAPASFHNEKLKKIVEIDEI